MQISILINPYPARVPVSSLRRFVEESIILCCSHQSRNIIIQPNTHIKIFGFILKNRNTAAKAPKQTPVHLAQTGN